MHFEELLFNKILIYAIRNIHPIGNHWTKENYQAGMMNQK